MFKKAHSCLPPSYIKKEKKIEGKDGAVIAEERRWEFELNKTTAKWYGLFHPSQVFESTV
jgi:hypothetical protein